MLGEEISKTSKTNSEAEGLSQTNNTEKLEKNIQDCVYSTNPPWNIPTAILVWLSSVLFVIFFPVLFIIPYAQYKKIESTNLQTLSDILQKDQTALILNLIAIIPAHLLTLLLAWFVVTNFQNRPFFQTLGLKREKIKFSQVILLVISFNLLALLLSALIPENKENDFIKLVSSSKPALYLTAFLAITTAPLVEEVVYRGILYPAFERTLGISKAIVLVSLLFGLVHIPQYYPSGVTIFLIFALSVILTIIRAYTGNLFPCIIIHTLHNSVQASLLIFQNFYERS